MNDLETADVKINSTNIILKNIDIPNIRLIKIIGDGNCYFHSILHAMLTEYITSKDKVEIMKTHKKYMIKCLPSLYNKLSRGKLKELSIDVPEYSLEHMIKTLESNSYVGHLFNELVGLIYNIDIYIISAQNSDVYITGDEDYLLKSRPSVVLYYTGSHYNLLGVSEKKSLITFFQWDHEFIKAIKNRIQKIKIEFKK
jgi:hypothetical protein